VGMLISLFLERFIQLNQQR